MMMMIIIIMVMTVIIKVDIGDSRSIEEKIVKVKRGHQSEQDETLSANQKEDHVRSVHKFHT